jgi:CheY-like chemotaxis protein
MKKKILLVDDSIFDADFLTRALEACGYKNPITYARDGAEALDIIFSDPNAQERIGLILLDLKMPKLDGFEVLKVLKATPRLQNIPIIVVSASNLEADRVRADLLGAASYITKPMDPAELIRLLYVMLKPLKSSLIEE